MMVGEGAETMEAEGDRQEDQDPAQTLLLHSNHERLN